MRKAIYINLIVALYAVNALAQQPLWIPDTLSGTQFSLTMHKDSMQFLPGSKTQTFGINGAHYLGPTLLMNRGEEVQLSVTNQINDVTTMHWHGFHIPAEMDGGPHTPIADGATWTPHFKVMNQAATYWYHPHFHGKTALHVMKGAAGLIIVRDSVEAQLDLPRSYGIDDFPLIVQTQQLDPDNQIDSRGMEDSIILVNGTFDPYVDLPAQVIRLRILNAAGERTFNFGFTNNQPFYIIGSDGGLLSEPVSTTRVRLSPGERAEILIDLSGMTAQTIHLMSYASEIPMGVQGGPTMPMPPGSPPMDSPLNGSDFEMLQINIAAPTANPVTNIPSALVPVVPLAESEADITRQINFTADSAMVMDGPFYFNDSTFDMMRIDYQVALNSTEIWSLTNQTMVAHPFHIHDVQFQLLDRDGNPPPPAERGWKDLVLVAPNETVRFIARFEDFTNDTIPYMYHCHILMHEDDGMMGQFLVTMPNSIGSVTEQDMKMMLYPNPASNSVTVSFGNPDMVKDARLMVSDISGRQIYSTTITGATTTIQTSGWANGAYLLSVQGEQIRKAQLFTIGK